MTKEQKTAVKAARSAMRRAIKHLQVAWPNESAMEKRLDDFCDELGDVLDYHKGD